MSFSQPIRRSPEYNESLSKLKMNKSHLLERETNQYFLTVWEQEIIVHKYQNGVFPTIEPIPRAIDSWRRKKCLCLVEKQNSCFCQDPPTEAKSLPDQTPDTH